MKRAYITAQEAVNIIQNSYNADEKVIGFTITFSQEDLETAQKKFGNHRQPAADVDLMHIDSVEASVRETALEGKNFE